MENTDAEVAKFGKALSDAKRVALLRHLMSPNSSECCGLSSSPSDGVCNCDLQQVLDIPQATVSYHVKILREANLVIERPRGKWTYITLNPEMAESLSHLFDHITAARSDNE